MTENTTTDYALQNDGKSGNANAQQGGIASNLSFESAKMAATYVGAEATKIGRSVQDGSASFRVLAFLGAVFMIITSFLDFLGGLLHVNFTHVLISIIVCASSIIIFILEGRERLPEKLRPLQSKLYEEARFFRLITGRGIFYFFAGLLQFSHWSFLNMISGGFMMFVGLLYVVVGRATGKKLAEVRAAIRDETKLQVSFADHDSDNDGYLTQEDFNNMIKKMELELSKNELTAAFTAIDANDDGKISFDEFKTWWSGSQATGPINMI